jgi:transketolase
LTYNQIHTNKKLINETKIKISIEAASTDCWKKYVGKDGLTFGIDTFGKSAPYKEIYKHFGLTAANIAKQIKKIVRKKI